MILIKNRNEIVCSILNLLSKKIFIIIAEIISATIVEISEKIYF